MFVWTASRYCVGCLGKLGIITFINVVLFLLVWYFFDVYLYTNYCISYTCSVDKFDFKKWYKSGDVVLIYRLFWIVSGKDMLILV